MIECPVCKGKGFFEGKYNYLKCRKCNSFVLRKMPSEKEIKSLITEYEGTLFTANSSINEKFHKHLLKRMSLLRQYIKPRSKIFDIGCGGGDFLEIVKKEGYKAYAMDKSVKIVNEMKKRGFTAYQNLSKAPINYFDVITLFDVIEHTPEPRGMIKELIKKLRNNAIVMVTTPNCLGITAKLFANQIENEYPDHCVVFNPNSLKMLLEEEGFEILSIRTDTILQWYWSKNILLQKIVNKLIYILLKPFSPLLFQIQLGDNIEIIARKSSL